MPGTVPKFRTRFYVFASGAEKGINAPVGFLAYDVAGPAEAYFSRHRSKHASAPAKYKTLEIPPGAFLGASF